MDTSWIWIGYYTAHKKMKFSMKDFFSKCDQTAVFDGFGHIY